VKVVVVGASGNVGSALLRALVRTPDVDQVVGVARRIPPAGDSRLLSGIPAGDERLTWARADIGRDRLDVVAGADVVVHLAWMIQPQHDEPTLRATNVVGTRRLVDAVVEHHVPALVYASSVGTYAPAPKSPRLDESWPATGVPTLAYSRHKAEVEAMLDVVEREHPDLRVVRMRTSLVFQRGAASEVHRLFLGHLPWHLPRLLRLVPSSKQLCFQATHADDIADAYVRAITRPVRGAFNIAAEPVLDPPTIAHAVRGRTVPVPMRLLRLLALVGYELRVQPSEPGWLDLALQSPIMDVSRARSELEWEAVHTSAAALLELLDGIGDGAGDATEPLTPRRRDRATGSG
jgi:UDP-glucose 4-epimerase